MNPSVNRKTLPADKKDFLTKAINVSRVISEWTREKAIFMRMPAFDLHPVVVLTDILIESQWGTHPLAASQYNKKNSNNLTLLRPDSIWQGKNQKYENKEYKSYTDWLHFATDYSDLLIFSAKYSKVLKTNDIDDQFRRLAATKRNPAIYICKVSELRNYYGLDTFN